MSARRKRILESIEQERARQDQLPGSEFDQKHSPNDWIAIAAMYLTRAANRKSTPSTKEEFRDSLVKAAAVILAALEHND